MPLVAVFLGVRQCGEILDGASCIVHVVALSSKLYRARLLGGMPSMKALRQMRQRGDQEDALVPGRARAVEQNARCPLVRASAEKIVNWAVACLYLKQQRQAHVAANRFKKNVADDGRGETYET